MNSFFNNTYGKGTSYSPRQKTDYLFKIGEGCFDICGPFRKNIDIIKNQHLKNAETWRIFVEQFKNKTDDKDKKWRGEYWGKMMRGAVFTYLADGDEELYEVLSETVHDMLAAQGTDGSFTTYAESAFTGWDMWSRKYVMLGFEYFLEICKDKELSEKIITALCAHVDAIILKVGKEDGKLSILETSQNWQGVNSCSIIEPFVRLYNITENKSYLDFAGYIVDIGASSVGNLFEIAYKDELPPSEYPVRKAYEIMSCFEGLLEYYRATGIEKHKTAVLNFAKAVMREEITVIGCAGTWHEIFDNSAKYQIDFEHTGIMQETCVTVTWMKICYQLLCLTGEICFADYFELAAYNAMLGAVNSEGVERYLSAFPFDSYSPVMYNARARCSSGHNVMGENDNFEYGCCASIGSAGLGLIPITSVLTSNAGFFFNMYIPGTVATKSPSDNGVSFVTKTDFPKGNEVKIKLLLKSDERMTLSFRIPKYCKNASAYVNGASYPAVIGEYLPIDRVWQDGDEISLFLESPVRTFKVAGPKDYGEYHVALFKGPVALARDARLGEEVDGIVDICIGDDGEVTCRESSDAGFSTNLEYTVMQRDGTSFKVVDYASAGKTWDKESMLTVWMATKKYWNVDISLPTYMECINYAEKAYVTDVGGELRCIEKERNKAYKWRFVPVDGYYVIKSPDGRCITAEISGNDSFIVLKDYEGKANQQWKVEKFVQDRYQIVSREYGCHLHEIRWDRVLHRMRLYAYNEGADERFSVRSNIGEQSVKSVTGCTFKFSN